MDLADTPDETGYSQRSAYQAVFTTLRKALADCAGPGVQAAAGRLPANPAGLSRRLHPRRDGLRSADPTAAGAGTTFSGGPGVSQGAGAAGPGGDRTRRPGAGCWSTSPTPARGTSPGRLHALLTRHGSRVAVLKADAVKPDRREAWVAERVQEGLDVLVCHPRLVQTGLDLIEFPTVCWYETDYSVYTLRQASRRSWRIGQTRPVQVVYLAYRQTLQADALTLVAKKLQSSLAVEGELPEDGLAAYGDDGDDLLLALARQIVSGETAETEPVEAVFAQAQAAAADAEALLVDEGWQPVVETEPGGGRGPPPSRPTGRVRPPQRSTATVGTTTPWCRSRSRSRGRNSWTRCRPSARAGANRRPRPCRSSSGSRPRSGRRRIGSASPARPAWDADRSSTGKPTQALALASPSCPYLRSFSVVRNSC